MNDRNYDRAYDRNDDRDDRNRTSDRRDMNRDDRSYDAYRAQNRNPNAGSGMSLRDEYQDRFDRPYGEGNGYGVYGDRDQGYGLGSDRSTYSDRDMGNLERDRYGRGDAVRGDQYQTRYQSRQSQAGYGRDRSEDREIVRPTEDSQTRQRGYGTYAGGGDERWDRQGQSYGDQSYGDQANQGQAYQGQHYGRGPKNYQRSDDRIREDVNEQLTYHHDLDATDIEVKAENGEVTLTGTVSDRRQKRMAEDAAEGVRGVKDVHNQLRVRRDQDESSIPGASDQPSGGQQGSDLSATQMSGGDTTGLTTAGTTISSTPASGRRNTSNKQS